VINRTPLSPSVKFKEISMKSFIVSMHLMLLMCNLSYGNEIKIYDNGKIEDKVYYSEKFGKNVHAKYIKYIGKPKGISKIRDSEAKNIKAKEKLNANIINWVKKAKVSNYTNQGNRETNISEIIDFVSIEKPTCAEITLSCGGRNIMILDASFIGTIKNDYDYKKHNKPLNIVWVGRYDNEKVIETFFIDLSISSIYDNVRKVSVDAIADIDNDGTHEIIIKDTRYAGFLYHIIHLTDSGYIIKELHADSWD